MSRAKVAVVCGLMALMLSACGIQSKPEAGATAKQFRASAGNQSRVDNPRIKQVACLKSDKLKFREYYAQGAQHRPAIQVGSLPTGPTMIFYPTAGIAQGRQITGQETAAAVIGNLLVYPNQASRKLLKKVQACASIGVAG